MKLFEGSVMKSSRGYYFFLTVRFTGVWRKLNDGLYNFYLPANTCIRIKKRKIFGGQSTGHLRVELKGNYYTILARIYDAKRQNWGLTYGFGGRY
jgi:hypothetical protein